MNSMLINQATKFLKDCQRFAVIGTSRFVKLTVTRTIWPCHGTVQRATTQ